MILRKKWLYLIVVLTGMGCSSGASNENILETVPSSLCHLLKYQCAPSDPELSLDEERTRNNNAVSECTDHLKADLKKFMDVNKVKFQTKQLEECRNAIGNTFNCADVTTLINTPPDACAPLKDWFTMAVQ